MVSSLKLKKINRHSYLQLSLLTTLELSKHLSLLNTKYIFKNYEYLVS